jgi:peptidoglycan/LPS O-acetylase OafA/YrhL
MNKERIEYLDGMKGTASLIVLFSHLVLGFYPYLHLTSQDFFDKQNIIIKIIGSTPLNLIYSGHFAVMVFFLITGYVLSYKYFTTPKTHEYITSGAFRRYFRLMIPALFSCLIAYFLLQFDLFLTAKPPRLLIPHGLPVSTTLKLIFLTW